jgi:hypothetical protein
MPYPPYSVTFDGVGVPNGRVQTPGSHTFRMTTRGGQLEVSLTHNDEAGDKIPTLNITFTDK